MGKNDNTGVGKEVRAAFDGPTVEHDDLIGQIEARAAEEYSRASDSSESAARTAAFLEKTALNSQAFSWLKSILKKLPKKDGQAKAMDVIRSLEIGLPMIKNHVAGQTTPDMLDGQAPEQTEDAPEADPQDLDVGDHVCDEDGDPEIAEDTEDFNAAVDQVEGDGVVTPIDFGGAATA